MMIGRPATKSSGFWHSRNKSANRGSVHRARAGLQSGDGAADISATMHTLGYRTHVLVAAAAAAGVIAALERPWYAKAPVPIEEATGSIGSLQGPADGFVEGAARWFSESAGTTGWDALGVWGTVLAALAGLTAAGAVGCLVPALQGVARELLRYGALACVAVALWKLVDQPGPNDALELRFGAFIAAGAALVALSSGGAVAAAPLPRRRPAPAGYTPPPPPGA
jgi:hypothetical protein